MKMNKTYYKPETRFVNLMNSYAFLSGSNTSATPDVGAGIADSEDLGGGTSRNAFWEDYDEDLLEDMDKEDIKDLK